MKLYMSNKLKNVGTVAKAKIYLQSVDSFSILAMHLAQHTFIPCILSLVSLLCKVSLCVLNSAMAYVYIDYALSNNR